MNDAMLQTILLVAIILVAVSLTGVVLLQRSEGGALGMGGGPSGFMTARGAGNLLTNITWVLAALLFGLTVRMMVRPNSSRPRPPSRPRRRWTIWKPACRPPRRPGRRRPLRPSSPPSNGQATDPTSESAPQGALSSFDQQFDSRRPMRRSRIME